jgi:Sulfotransferase family
MTQVFYSQSAAVRYIEVPKCASTSIKLALAASDGVDCRAYPHACGQWRRCPGDFVPCEVFTFVRHPLARLQSAWREKVKTGKARKLGGSCPLPLGASFADFVRWVTSHPARSVDKHWRPQTLLLAVQPPCDFIGRIERLREDWAQLQDRHGLPDLPHVNESPSVNVEPLDAATRLAIERFYSADLEAFGYRL